MRRLNVAVGLVGIAVLLAACGKGGGELPLLPGAQNASANGERSMAAGAADSSMMIANIRYELADGVTTDTKEAAAYDFADTNEAAVTKLAKALGVTGAVHKDGDNFTIGGGDDKPSLYVTASGGVFSMSVSYAVSGSGSSSSGCAVPPVAPDTPVASDTPTCEPMPATTTTIAPDAPRADDAKRVASEALQAGGVDVGDAKVSVESFDGSTQNVRFQHTVGGAVVEGYESYVTVGPKNAIVSASGYLVNPSSVGTYELASLTRAVERLNDSYGRATTLEGPSGKATPYGRDDVAVAPVEPNGGTGAPEGDPGTTEPPRVVKLTSVKVGLMMQSDYDGDLWLVPSYKFGTDDDSTVATEAAADKYIQQAPTTSAPAPADGGGATEPGGTAPSASSCENFDGDISGQVCASATEVKAGEPVTFRITAGDPDRGFASGCFDGVTASYGDDGPGDVRCEACSTDVPPGPGKMGVERSHTYEKPGTYTAIFTIRSGADCGQSDPKDSSAKVSLTIKVA
jgi:hypothetical protein